MTEQVSKPVIVNSREDFLTAHNELSMVLTRAAMDNASEISTKIKVFKFFKRLFSISHKSR